MGGHRRSYAIGSWGEPMRKRAAVRGHLFTLARVTVKINFVGITERYIRRNSLLVD